ncbi:MAG: hypothetical protein IT384_34395 [Deltaproteobacteria bacterium]|nr:hypothetical protein [Deltaproteobacteria bacterium]
MGYTKMRGGLALRAAVLSGCVSGCVSGCITSVDEDRYASVVELFLPGPDLAATEPYANPDRALGPPDGRTVALGPGAALILRFFRGIPDGPGADLRVVEIGPDAATAWIAASPDGVGFSEAAAPARDNGTTALDLGDLGLETASFVRIRGIGAEGDDPGFDLDAVEALH